MTWLSAQQQAKVVQENLIETSGVPYTIVHSTQVLEQGSFQSGYSLRRAKNPFCEEFAHMRCRVLRQR